MQVAGFNLVSPYGVPIRYDAGVKDYYGIVLNEPSFPGSDYRWNYIEGVDPDPVSKARMIVPYKDGRGFKYTSLPFTQFRDKIGASSSSNAEIDAALSGGKYGAFMSEIGPIGVMHCNKWSDASPFRWEVYTDGLLYIDGKKYSAYDLVGVSGLGLGIAGVAVFKVSNWVSWVIIGVSRPSSSYSQQWSLATGVYACLFVSYEDSDGVFRWRHGGVPGVSLKQYPSTIDGTNRAYGVVFTGVRASRTVDGNTTVDVPYLSAVEYSFNGTDYTPSITHTGYYLSLTDGVASVVEEAVIDFGDSGVEYEDDLSTSSTYAGTGNSWDDGAGNTGGSGHYSSSSNYTYSSYVFYVNSSAKRSLGVSTVTGSGSASGSGTRSSPPFTVDGTDVADEDASGDYICQPGSISVGDFSRTLHTASRQEVVEGTSTWEDVPTAYELTYRIDRLLVGTDTGALGVLAVSRKNFQHGSDPAVTYGSLHLSINGVEVPSLSWADGYAEYVPGKFFIEDIGNGIAATACTGGEVCSGGGPAPSSRTCNSNSSCTKDSRSHSPLSPMHERYATAILDTGMYFSTGIVNFPVLFNKYGLYSLRDVLLRTYKNEFGMSADTYGWVGSRAVVVRISKEFYEYCEQFKE